MASSRAIVAMALDYCSKKNLKIARAWIHPLCLILAIEGEGGALIFYRHSMTQHWDLLPAREHARLLEAEEIPNNLHSVIDMKVAKSKLKKHLVYTVNAQVAALEHPEYFLFELTSPVFENELKSYILFDRWTGELRSHREITDVIRVILDEGERVPSFHI